MNKKTGALIRKEFVAHGGSSANHYYPLSVVSFAHQFSLTENEGEIKFNTPLADFVASTDGEIVSLMSKMPDAFINWGNKNGEASVMDIVLFLKHNDENVRVAAAEALGKYGELAQNVIPALAEALEDDHMASASEIHPKSFAKMPLLLRDR